MGHNLYYNEKTGKYSFYSVKERAWHGLGHIADNYQTSEEVLQHSGLDFTVEKRPNRHAISEDLVIESTTSFFTFRTDTNEVLGDQLRGDYTVVQNREAFAFFDAIAGENGIYYETAGALGKGGQIFITAKLPGYIRVGDDDLLEKYLFLTTSHDGSSSIIAAFTPIRIVCNNTLNAALAGCTNRIEIIHTANASHQIRDAHKIMKLCNTLDPIYNVTFNEWAGTKIDDPTMKRLIQLAIGSREALANLRDGKEDETSTVFQNQVIEIMQYALMADTQQMDTTCGTLYGFYNAITGYFQNVKEYKDDVAKIRSIFYAGTAQQKVQNAFRLCEQYAKHGSDGLRIP
jgi:phage/plasmid-like protein (TIGR03299 family)